MGKLDFLPCKSAFLNQGFASTRVSVKSTDTSGSFSLNNVVEQRMHHSLSAMSYLRAFPQCTSMTRCRFCGSEVDHGVLTFNIIQRYGGASGQLNKRWLENCGSTTVENNSTRHKIQTHRVMNGRLEKQILWGLFHSFINENQPPMAMRCCRSWGGGDRKLVGILTRARECQVLPCH